MQKMTNANYFFYYAKIAMVQALQSFKKLQKDLFSKFKVIASNNQFSGKFLDIGPNNRFSSKLLDI